MEKEKIEEISKKQDALEMEYHCRTFLNNYEYWREMAQKYMLPEKQEEQVKEIDEIKQKIEEANGDYSKIDHEVLWSVEGFRKVFDAIASAESMGTIMRDAKVTAPLFKSVYMSIGPNYDDRLKSTTGDILRDSVFIGDIAKEVVNDYTEWFKDRPKDLNESLLLVKHNFEEAAKYKSEHPEIFAQLYGSKETGTPSSNPSSLGE